MSYSMAVAQLLKDNPHAEGWFNTIGDEAAKFAWGYDWEAKENKDDQTGWTPDFGGAYGWEYNNQFEYIKRMACIAPIGVFTPYDMNLSSWDIQGKWKLASYSSYLKHRPLWFYDGRPDLYPGTEWGNIITKIAVPYNLQFHIWRIGAAPGETEPATFSIRLCGGEGGQQYQLTLPAYGRTGKEHADITGRTGDEFCKAILYGRCAGGDWSVVDTMGAGSAPALSEVSKSPKFQAVRIEYLPGALIISIGESESWVVTGPWWQRNGQLVEHVDLQPGQVEVRVIGHTAMFAMHRLLYPSGISIRPKRVAVVGGFFSNSPQYNVLGRGDAGTTITATPTPSPTEFGNGWYPDVRFTSNSPNYRAALYNIQEYRTAVLSTGVSNIQSTQDNPNFILEELSGETRLDYKGSTMKALITCAPGEELATIGANCGVRGLVNVHDGETSEQYNFPVTGTPYFTQMFSGYAEAPSKIKPPGVAGNIRAEVTASDIISSRLRKKCIDYQCSFEGNTYGNGWTVQSAFQYLLNSAGVPNSLISINAAMPIVNMPISQNPGKRLFKFQPDADYAQVIDTVVKAGWCWSVANPGAKRGMVWGVNPAGVVFLDVAREWDGTIDYTLDANSAVPEDMVMNFRSSKSLSEFKNILTVMAGEGEDAVARMLYDEGSWSDASASNFIGDIWKEFKSYPDGTDINAITNEIWERIARWNNFIQWETDDNPWLMPNNMVAVYPQGLSSGAYPDMKGLEIPAGSVYEIISKSWLSKAGGRFSQTLQAVRVA